METSFTLFAFFVIYDSNILLDPTLSILEDFESETFGIDEDLIDKWDFIISTINAGYQP